MKFKDLLNRLLSSRGVQYPKRVEGFDTFISDNIEEILKNAKSIDILVRFNHLRRYALFGLFWRKLIELGCEVRLLLTELPPDFQYTGIWQDVLSDSVGNLQVAIKATEEQPVRGTMFIVKTDSVVKVLYEAPDEKGGSSSDDRLFYDILNPNSKNALDFLLWFRQIWNSSVVINEKFLSDNLQPAKPSEALQPTDVQHDEASPTSSYDEPSKQDSQSDELQETMQAVRETQEDVAIPSSKKDLLKMPVEAIFSEGLLSKCVNYFHENGIYYAEDLLDFDFNRLYYVHGVGRKKVARVKQLWNEFLKNLEAAEGQNILLDVTDSVPQGEAQTLIPPIDVDALTDEIFRGKLREIVESRYGMVLKLRAQGKTLQDIADFMLVTRERVRQIERSCLNDIQRLLGMFSAHILRKFEGKAFATSEDFNAILGEDELTDVLVYALKNSVSEKFQFFEALGIFLINIDIEWFSERLRKVINEQLPNTFKFDDHKDKLLEALKGHGLDFITPDMLKRYLLSLGYREYGKYMSIRRLTIGDVAKTIIGQYFPEKVRIYDPEFITRFRIIAREEFDLCKEDELDRYIINRISDSLVLCGRGLYTLPENVHIQEDILKDIKRYIDNYPEDIILFKEIFARFQDRLSRESNVDNDYFLHGVLKLHFSDEYHFDKDSISKVRIEQEEIPHKRKSLHEALEEYLQGIGRPVSKDEITRDFPGLTEIMITNVLNLNPNILRWDDGYLIHRDFLKFNESDINSLRTIIDRELNSRNGYTNANLIYPYVREECYDFIAKNEISNPSNLYFALEFIFGDEYKFSNPHILHKGYEGRFTNKDIIYNYVKEKREVTIRELIDLFTELRLNPNSVYNCLEDLKDKLVYLSPELLILKEDFSIPDDRAQAIRDKIGLSTKDKDYLILARQDLEYFPYIGYSWNFYLLESVIDNYISEFKLLKEPKEDAFAFVLKRDLPIDSCEDMVKHILDEELTGKMITTTDLEELMREKGIFNSRLYRRMLKVYERNISDLTGDEH